MRLKRFGALLAALVLSACSQSASTSQGTPFQMRVAGLPAGSHAELAVSQAGSDDPAKNPGNAAPVFDVVHTQPQGENWLVPVSADQRALAEANFDVAAVMRSAVKGRVIVIDCPVMRAKGVSTARRMPITARQALFVANEVMPFAQQRNRIAAQIMTHTDLYACNHDRLGIFDPDAPVHPALIHAVLDQLFKMVTELL